MRGRGIPPKRDRAGRGLFAACRSNQLLEMTMRMLRQTGRPIESVYRLDNMTAVQEYQTTHQ